MLHVFIDGTFSSQESCLLLTMVNHKDIFLMLYGSNEGGLTKIANQDVFICRICQMTPNTGLKSEPQWVQHLLSDSHQSIHRHYPLLRKFCGISIAQLL